MKTTVFVTLLIIAAGIVTYTLRHRAEEAERAIAAEQASHAADNAERNAMMRKVEIDGAEKLFAMLSKIAETTRRSETMSGDAVLAGIHYETTMTNLYLQRSASIQAAKDAHP